MNHIELRKKLFPLLEKYNLPIPVKAEEVKGKKLISILRVGAFKEPLLIFEDNKAVWIQENYVGDSYFTIDSYKVVDFFPNLELDIEDYIYKLKDINYPNAKKAWDECVELIKEFVVEQKREQLKRLKKELGET